MSLDFVPRKLQKRTLNQTTKSNGQDTLISEPPASKGTQEGKGKQKAAPDAVSDEHVLTYLKLAFSEYTLHKDEDIRVLLESIRDEDCKPLFLSHSGLPDAL